MRSMFSDRSFERLMKSRSVAEQKREAFKKGSSGIEAPQPEAIEAACGMLRTVLAGLDAAHAAGSLREENARLRSSLRALEQRQISSPPAASQVIPISDGPISFEVVRNEFGLIRSVTGERFIFDVRRDGANLIQGVVARPMG